jgi:hypothetical protein
MKQVIYGVMVLTLLLLSGCLAGVRQQEVEEAGVAGERPGLSVVYIFKKYRSVDQIPVGKAALRMGRPGKPVLILDQQSGKDGYVFDSGRSQGVATVMDGFLDLEKTGIYRFQALANDGIRMFVNNTMIFEDPKVHKDRMSPVGTVQVAKPGKYPVRIVYFQRKGTAALKLYWQPPGESGFSLVPATAYSH